MASTSEKLTAFFEGRLNLRPVDTVRWPTKPTSEPSKAACQHDQTDTYKRVEKKE